MIRIVRLRPKYTYTFLVALVIHVLILTFVKKDIHHFKSLSRSTHSFNQPLRIDQIRVISPSEVEKFRSVGIKDGKKDAKYPDIKTPQFPLAKIPKSVRPQPSIKEVSKLNGKKSLSLENLAPKIPRPAALEKALDTAIKKESSANQLGKSLLKPAQSKAKSPFYFSYKDEKVIPRSSEQEELKNEAIKSFSTGPLNKATESISNFEIRYERPEGVSEDELNSDEKAYYSFYVRSYKNYFSKIYSNYERLVLQRPALAQALEGHHLLIGKIDYDENGNIVTVKILKSSESDDLHYFFEETLKQLNQPNPPKIFTKNRKQFSIYYQLQIH